MGDNSLEPLLKIAIAQHAELLKTLRSHNGMVSPAQAQQRLQSDLHIVRLAHAVGDIAVRDTSLQMAARWGRALALLNEQIDGASLQWRDTEGDWQIPSEVNSFSAPLAIQALAAAYLIGDVGSQRALLRRGLFKRLVEHARLHQGQVGSEVFWVLLGEIFCNTVTGEIISEAEFDDCRSAFSAGSRTVLDSPAIEYLLRPLLDVLHALSRQDMAAWQGAFHVAQTAHQHYYAAPERVGLTLGFLALELSAALSIAHARLGWVLADTAECVTADLIGRMPNNPTIEFHLVCPLRKVRDSRQAHWCLDLDGAPRSKRTHRLREHNGALITDYEVDDGFGIDQWHTSFILSDDASPLDAGELLGVSDLLAAQVDAHPTIDLEKARTQRALLQEALDALDMLLGLIPDGDMQPPEAAFFTARGRSIRDIDRNRFDADRLRARRDAYAALLMAEDHSTPSAPTAEAREESARKNALVTIEILKQQLTPLLHALARDTSANLSASLRPRSDDYAKAFAANIADAARTTYESFWVQAPRVDRVATNFELQCHIAPAGVLGDDNGLSRFFPGGYRGIASLLVPNRVWVAWKYIAPGQTAGMAYDGLVWLDDHWAWFPKPYRVLANLVR